MKTFLSYTRTKDTYNAVTEFRDHLAQELSLISSDSDVFQDRSHIGAGDHFPEVLEDAIKQATVLIVLISPAWLESKWCRKEFELFTNAGRDAARLNRVLPVLWVNTPALANPGNDSIATALAKINYADWRDLRHENWSNAELGRQVNKLAERAVALGG